MMQRVLKFDQNPIPGRRVSAMGKICRQMRIHGLRSSDGSRSTHRNGRCESGLLSNIRVRCTSVVVVGEAREDGGVLLYRIPDQQPSHDQRVQHGGDQIRVRRTSRLGCGSSELSCDGPPWSVKLQRGDVRGEVEEWEVVLVASSLIFSSCSSLKLQRAVFCAERTPAGNCASSTLKESGACERRGREVGG